MRLVGLLGKNADILPIRLWCYTGNHHSRNGKLADHSPEEIEAAVGWWGEAGKMVEAMLTVGFLDKIENGYRIHAWLEHSGHLAAFHKRAKHAAKERWKKWAKNATGDASSNAQASAGQCPNPSIVAKSPVLPSRPRSP